MGKRSGDESGDVRSAELKSGRIDWVAVGAEFESLSRVFATTDDRLTASGQLFIAPDEEPLNSNILALLFSAGVTGLDLAALFLQQSCDFFAAPDEQA